MSNEYNVAVEHCGELKKQIEDFSSEIEQYKVHLEKLITRRAICEAELRGLERGLGARAAEESEFRDHVPPRRGVTAEDTAESTRRSRRPVRAMILNELISNGGGLTITDLMERLDIRKAQVELVLEHHSNEGNAYINNGLWFATRSAEPSDDDGNGTDPAPDPEFELKEQPHV